MVSRAVHDGGFSNTRRGHFSAFGQGVEQLARSAAADRCAAPRRLAAVCTGIRTTKRSPPDRSTSEIALTSWLSDNCASKERSAMA